MSFYIAFILCSALYWSLAWQVKRYIMYKKYNWPKPFWLRRK
jgi:hypothetical protein